VVMADPIRPVAYSSFDSFDRYDRRIDDQSGSIATPEKRNVSTMLLKMGERNDGKTEVVQLSWQQQTNMLGSHWNIIQVSLEVNHGIGRKNRPITISKMAIITVANYTNEDALLFFVEDSGLLKRRDTTVMNHES
jgi:hypothetical protein